ncbi:789_t:CDS:2 [Rhizophagus irregularis]|nr:789_t:CDS:2 [Rhizophagus irregularis]
MRWNSTYLAWKCLLKLHNSIRFVSTSLLSKSDRASQKEGEKLEHLCLLESSRKRTQTESVAEDTNKAIPTDTTLIVTFLNPRFKYFKWSTNSERDRANQLVKKLYDELKINLHVSDDIEYRSLEKNNDDNDNLFSDLEGNFTQTNIEEEDEGLTLYKVSLFLDNQIFSAGQAYVILSRCPNWSNIYIAALNPSTFITDQSMIKEYE